MEFFCLVLHFKADIVAVFRQPTITICEFAMVPAAFTAGLGVGLSFLLGPNIGAIALVPVLVLCMIRLFGERIVRMMED